MDNKIDGCLECGSNDFTNIAGVVTCKNCGMQYPEMKLGKIEKPKTMHFNSLKDLLTNKSKISLSILIAFIILLIFVIGFISFEFTKPTVSQGTVLNISNIVLDVHDAENMLNGYNSSGNNEYYSSGKLNFDVVTDGFIYNYSANINFYDGDKIIHTYSTQNSYKVENLTKGFNHVSVLVYNSFTGSGLPQVNGTITAVSITLAGEVNGVNTKLFEAPKTNLGNVKTRYYTTPNPNYKK